MLRSMLELKKYTIGATDGEIGHVSDFFFDDRSWIIRYLVIETGSWLMGRKVLLSPQSLMAPDWMHKRLPVRISRDQVKNSPDIDTEQPVSRQHETQYADYYGYPYYWGETMALAPVDPTAIALVDESDSAGDPHLRSCQAVLGYSIHGTDGDVGKVQSMLVDEQNWGIRYLVVETSRWWSGHQVLIAPNWLTTISWAQSTVSVNLTRDAIKDSPSFDSTAELNRRQEAALYRHYQRPSYWELEQAMARQQELKREIVTA